MCGRAPTPERQLVDPVHSEPVRRDVRRYGYFAMAVERILRSESRVIEVPVVIHIVPVARAFLIQIFAFSKGVHRVVLFFIRGPDKQTATLVRVRFFRVIVDLT